MGLLTKWFIRSIDKDENISTVGLITNNLLRDKLYIPVNLTHQWMSIYNF